MTFLPRATTPSNLPCPSPTLHALSPICCWTQPSILACPSPTLHALSPTCCWTQPSNSLTQLSLSLSIHNLQLRPTTHPPTPSAAASPFLPSSTSLTHNTAYLKDVLQAVRPVAVWNIWEEEGRKQCRSHFERVETGQALLSESPLTERVHLLQYDEEWGGTLIATPFQAHKVFNWL